MTDLHPVRTVQVHRTHTWPRAQEAVVRLRNAPVPYTLTDKSSQFRRPSCRWYRPCPSTFFSFTKLIGTWLHFYSWCSFPGGSILQQVKIGSVFLSQIIFIEIFRMNSRHSLWLSAGVNYMVEVSKMSRCCWTPCLPLYLVI